MRNLITITNNHHCVPDFNRKTIKFNVDIPIVIVDGIHYGFAINLNKRRL